MYPDLPGHGGTARVVATTSEAVLEAVVAFIEQRAQEPVLMTGCSYGGYLASAVARRRPDLVRGLLLVCPGVRRKRDLPDASDLPSESGWLDAAPADLRDHFDQALGRRTGEVVRAVSSALAAGGAGDEGYQDALRGGGSYFFHDDAATASFEGPVAVLTGRQDRIVGFADQFRRMSMYPQGTFVISDLAGHYLPYEQSGLLRSIAQEWLQRCGIAIG